MLVPHSIQGTIGCNMEVFVALPRFPTLSLTHQPGQARWCYRQDNIHHSVSRLFHACHMSSVSTCFHLWSEQDTSAVWCWAVSTGRISGWPALMLRSFCRALTSLFMFLLTQTDLCKLTGLQVLPHATSTDKDTSNTQNLRRIIQQEWRANFCLWPPYEKTFPVWGESCFSLLSLHLVIL